MDFQKCYHAVMAFQETGTTETNHIINHYFMRSGEYLDFEAINEIYSEIKAHASKYGYSDPKAYLTDVKMDIIDENISTFDRYIDIEKVKTFLEGKDIKPPKSVSQNSPVWTISEATTSKPLTPITEIIEPSSEKAKTEQIKKPIKLKLENESFLGNEVMQSKIKNRISKNKKKSQIYKEMDAIEKELDNRFDGYFFESQHSNISENTLADLPLPENSPFSCTFLGSLDIEFRKVMHKLCIKDKTQAKEKTGTRNEMMLLREYFDKKLGIVEEDDLFARKTVLMVAGFMKRIQDEIFNSDDQILIKLLAIVKNKLCNFYNIHKK